ncbi:MAG: hypothetical protein JXB34_05975 [Bacteroidales bacterium]|nr:hypothetical protein [Bacteroidales bacterium]
MRLIQSYQYGSNNTGRGSATGKASAYRGEGDITVEKTINPKTKKISKNEGDYINYEEL